jgi:nucleoside-diphosphate-sugar epimerase
LIIENDLEFIFTNIKDICMDFSYKTFFITGGTGFFGKWFLHFFIYLKEKKNINIKIYVLSRNPEYFLKQYSMFDKDYIIFIKGDIREFKFIDGRVDYILHLAATNAEETFNNMDPLEKFESSAFGIKRILEFARIKKIKKFLFASSGSIYGKNCKEKFISENCLNSPNILDNIASALPEGKRVSEFYCSYYANKYNIDIVIARCFSFVGPYLPLDIHYAIGNFINDSIKNKEIIIKGNGSQIRSYMYISELIVWLFVILLKGKKAEAYNVGSDYEISILNLAKLVASNFKDVKIKILNKKIRKTAAANRYVPNISKAKKELGLNIYSNLDENIKKTIKFYNEV